MRLTLTAIVGVTAVLCGLASAAPVQPGSSGEDGYTSIELNGLDQPVNEHEYDEVELVGFSTQKRSEIEVEMEDFTQPFDVNEFEEVEMVDFTTPQKRSDIEVEIEDFT